MSAARIRRLTLAKFRSYRAASLAVDAQLAVLVGPNGAGKTNLIEAISFLAPGRGLRRATLDEVAFAEGDGAWAVARSDSRNNPHHHRCKFRNYVQIRNFILFDASEGPCIE